MGAVSPSVSTAWKKIVNLEGGCAFIKTTSGHMAPGPLMTTLGKGTTEAEGCWVWMSKELSPGSEDTPNGCMRIYNPKYSRVYVRNLRERCRYFSYIKQPRGRNSSPISLEACANGLNMMFRGHPMSPDGTQTILVESNEFKKIDVPNVATRQAIRRNTNFVTGLWIIG